jgi:hypothetical protein
VNFKFTLVRTSSLLGKPEVYAIQDKVAIDQTEFVLFNTKSYVIILFFQLPGSGFERCKAPKSGFGRCKGYSFLTIFMREKKMICTIGSQTWLLWMV